MDNNNPVHPVVFEMVQNNKTKEQEQLDFFLYLNWDNKEWNEDDHTMMINLHYIDKVS